GALLGEFVTIRERVVMPAKSATPNATVPRPTRWRRRLVLGALLLLVLLWMAPKIVAWTGLRDWVVNKIFARVDGTIHVGSASLGWFSPVVLRNVTVTDRAGAKVLFVARIE